LSDDSDLMVLWRISRHRDLKGEGGLRAPGRWHLRGRPIVYLAETPAGALLKICVHTSANDIPGSFTLLRIAVPKEVSYERLDHAKLPGDWIDNAEVTREVGSAWLRSSRSALLCVPSALVPETFNVLLNPLHRDAGLLQIVSAHAYPFDPRIKK
jgi:RES domain-containing protein